MDINKITEKITLPVALIFSVVVLLMVLSFAFYWYEVRAEKIQSECAKLTLEIGADSSGVEDLEFFYHLCVEVGGIENLYKVLDDIRDR